MWMHWKMNSNVCILTTIEHELTGIKYNEGFINNVLTPIFELPKNSNAYVVWVGTTILLIIDIVKLNRTGFRVFTMSYQMLKDWVAKLYAKVVHWY